MCCARSTACAASARRSCSGRRARARSRRSKPVGEGRRPSRGDRAANGPRRLRAGATHRRCGPRAPPCARRARSENVRERGRSKGTRFRPADPTLAQRTLTMQNRALGVVASTLLMAASAAQDQERLPPVPLFLDSRVSPMPLFMADTVALYPAHLDGDRHLDLVVVNRRPGVTYPYAGSWVLRGVGDGRLRNDAPYDEYNSRLILGAADLDGDGDIDLPFQHEFVPGMGIGINNGSG